MMAEQVTQECNYRIEGKRLVINCICGKEFTRPKSYLTIHPSKRRFYCSQQCWASTRKIHHFAGITFTQKESTAELRRKAMQKVSPELKCVCCGCDVFELLEFNHKNGGGNEEFRKIKHRHFYLKIISGRRKTDDLDIRCIVCNAVHKVELKGFSGFFVTYAPKFASEL